MADLIGDITPKAVYHIKRHIATRQKPEKEVLGFSNWTRYEYTVTSNGNYTFKWVYEKDYSVNSGDDTGWLDDVEVVYVNPPEPPYMLGDIDQNGQVQVTDAVLALRWAMGLITLEDVQLLAGDVDLNGEVNITDALMIMRYAMGVINEF